MDRRNRQDRENRKYSNVGAIDRNNEKNRQTRKYRGTIAAIIVLVAAVVILWVFVLGSGRDGDARESGMPNTGGAAPAPDEAGEPGEPGEPEASGDGPEDPVAAGPEIPPFFDEGRAERYEAFAAISPHLAFDDVIWMVNVDLDKTPYEDTGEVPDPLSVTALVTKHFNLPEGFSPPDLVYIGQSMMREEAASAMNDMISAAADEGHHLWVQSGYRSFSIQVGLYAQYSARDGEEGADRYSARPGHSEHQTGLVADLNTITDAFGDTPEGMWAADNCWYFGFIVRYTEENSDVTLYKSEPWHLRYIGREAATAMHDLDILSFEEYWAKYLYL